MLSIIICSRTPKISSELSKNIKETIGCAYELIVIDNSENKYSIFEAYNLGIQKSSGAYLCFIHDDIFFHTIGWGNKINEIFKSDDNIGLIGVAGAKIKTKMPSGWFNCPNEFQEINIIQHLKNKKVEKWEYGFNNGSISEVVAIDGVFMVMRKVESIQFNTKLKGFHNYDLNLSIEIKIKGFKIVVTNDILIEHFSAGNINQSWCESTIELHEIYKDYLPLKANDILNTRQLDSLEFKNGTWVLNYLLSYGHNKQAIKLWLKLLYIKPYSEFHIDFLKKQILKIIRYKILKLKKLKIFKYN